MKVLVVGDHSRLNSEMIRGLKTCLPDLDIAEKGSEYFASNGSNNESSKSLILLNLDHLKTEPSKQFISRLRSPGGSSIICFAGWQSEYRRLRQFLDLGVNDFFLQPVDLDELKQLVLKYSDPRVCE